MYLLHPEGARRLRVKIETGRPTVAYIKIEIYRYMEIDRQVYGDRRMFPCMLRGTQPVCAVFGSVHTR